jgi:hypothetical protein
VCLQEDAVGLQMLKARGRLNMYYERAAADQENHLGHFWRAKFPQEKVYRFVSAFCC